MTAPVCRPVGVALTLGPPQPPPRPVPSCPVRVGFNASCAPAGPEPSMPGDPGSSFIRCILPFFTGSSVARWASRLRQGLGGRGSNRGWGPDRAGFPVGDRQWKSWEGRESRLREAFQNGILGPAIGETRTAHTHAQSPFHTPSPCPAVCFLRRTPFPWLVFTRVRVSPVP